MAYGSQYLIFERFAMMFKGRKVSRYYYVVGILLAPNARIIQQNIYKMELRLGGDHGKDTFTFIACLITQFEDPLEEPHVLEFQIGEVRKTQGSCFCRRWKTRRGTYIYESKGRRGLYGSLQSRRCIVTTF